MSYQDTRKQLENIISELNREEGESFVLGDHIDSGGFTHVYELKGYPEEGEFVLKYTPRAGAAWEAVSDRKRREIDLLKGDVDERYVPRIYRAYQYSEDENLDIPDCYLVIERKQITMGDYFRRNHQRLPLIDHDQIFQILKDLLEALDYIHTTLNLVHKDIKPENISYNPATGRFMFIDFNISRQIDSRSIKTTTTPFITLAYCAPEYIGMGGKEKQYTPRMDIYSLGATLFYWLTRRYCKESDGQNPLLKEYSAETKASLLAVSPIPLALQRIILRAIEEDPEFRFQSAREMLDSLEQYELEKDHPDALLEEIEFLLKELDKEQKRTWQNIQDLLHNEKEDPAEEDPGKDDQPPDDQPKEGFLSDRLGDLIPGIIAVAAVIVVIAVIVTLFR